MAQNELNYQVVVIGGSAGSLDVVLKIIEALPVKSNVVFVIVLHRKTDAGSVLTRVLSSHTTLPVKEVEDKEPVLQDTVYIAPANYHLLFEEENTFALDASEKVHYSRPSIDITFESAAQVFGSKAIGVLLSGANADGAQGLKTIKEAGGFTLVQNPETAEVGFMPQQAIQLGVADKILHAKEMGEFILEFIRL